jgi:hypothetical protein
MSNAPDVWAALTHLFAAAPTATHSKELCVLTNVTKLRHGALQRIIAAVRNNVWIVPLASRRRNSFRRAAQWLAEGRTRNERTATFKLKTKVRAVSKQRWVIRRYGSGGSNPISRCLPRRTAWCVATALLVSASSPALNQVVSPISPSATPPWSSLDVFDPVPFSQLWGRDPADAADPEDNPVKTRQQPGYESVGIRAGTWMFNPSVTGGALYNSNVFATGSDKQGDLAAVIQPSLGISSLWERHALDVQGSVRSIDYRKFSSLNQTDANLRVRGRVDLWHDAAILTNFRVASLHEGVGSLTSPTGAVEPTPYNYATGDVTYWQQIDRFAGSFGVRHDIYNYGSTRAQDGSIINQDSRDGHVDVAHGRLDYAISANLGLFSSLEVNRRDFRGTPTQSLSSDGYRSLTGLNIQLGHLVSGEISAGYSSQRFVDPTIGTIAGPTYRAVVNWSVTRMLDLHFKADSIVTQASDTVAGGIRADAFQLGADYELRRNIVLSVAGTYERDKFFGQPRNDNVYSTLTELKFLINRYSYIAAQHQYVRRESSAPLSSYDKHEVGLSVTAHY